MQWRSAYSKVVGSELTSLDLETLPVRQRYQGMEWRSENDGGVGEMVGGTYFDVEDVDPCLKWLYADVPSVEGTFIQLRLIAD